jgi:hypothetical protein
MGEKRDCQEGEVHTAERCLGCGEEAWTCECLTPEEKARLRRIERLLEELGS